MILPGQDEQYGNVGPSLPEGLDSFAGAGGSTVGLRTVDTRDLTAFVQFSSGEVRRETVFESERLWCQVLSFERGQRIGPLGDASSDAIFTILAGEAAFQVNGRRKRLAQWGTILVPSGARVTVTNASVDPLVLLLVAAPPPEPEEQGTTG